MSAKLEVDRRPRSNGPVPSWPISSWTVIAGLWAAATLLSTAQIYLREVARGALEVPLRAVLLANVLAWLPWLAIAPFALCLERRFPLAGSRTGLHLLVHIVAAVFTSLTFLFYLAAFHASYLEGGGQRLSLQRLRLEYAEKLGEYFLIAALLYVTIVLGSFGCHVWSAFGNERRRVERLAAKTELLESARSNRVPEPLFVRSVGEVEKVDPRDVDWIEGCGNYARLHLKGRRLLIRRTLSSLCEELSDLAFVRIHRSAIVNSGRVVKVEAATHGDAIAELSNGKRLKVSRTYRRVLEDAAL